MVSKERIDKCNEFALKLQAVTNYKFISVWPYGSNEKYVQIYVTLDTKLIMNLAKAKASKVYHTIKMFCLKNNIKILPTQNFLTAAIEDFDTFIGLFRIKYNKGIK